nr:hypothetical protein [Yonghaparkia sp. Soil809]
MRERRERRRELLEPCALPLERRGLALAPEDGDGGEEELGIDVGHGGDRQGRIAGERGGEPLAGGGCVPAGLGEELGDPTRERVGQAGDVGRRRPLGELRGHPEGPLLRSRQSLVLAVGAGDQIAQALRAGVEHRHHDGEAAGGEDDLEETDERPDGGVTERHGASVIAHDPIAECPAAEGLPLGGRLHHGGDDDEPEHCAGDRDGAVEILGESERRRRLEQKPDEQPRADPVDEVVDRGPRRAEDDARRTDLEGHGLAREQLPLGVVVRPVRDRSRRGTGHVII